MGSIEVLPARPHGQVGVDPVADLLIDESSGDVTGATAGHGRCLVARVACEVSSSAHVAFGRVGKQLTPNADRMSSVMPGAEPECHKIGFRHGVKVGNV